MNRKILILALASLTSSAFAQTTAAEEAIILNQELQFLEDSVSNIQSVSTNTTSSTVQPGERATNSESLESTYFGETEEDSVSTKSAGQKRRGL